MCVWFPMWSLTRPDAPLDEPLLIVDDRVSAATADVLDVGVTLGMPRREAEALAPFATVMERDLGEETRRFEPVVAVVESLVPRVEVVAPGLVFVPVVGAVKYYGGEEQLVKHVDDALHAYFKGRGVSRRGACPFRAGIADGPFAARWAAASAGNGHPLIVEDTIGFLSRLDLETLRESMGGSEMIDTFRWLGIATLGDLARLPRETLASRFGEPGLVAHRLASGEDRVAIPREIPADLGVRMSFEDPLENLERVAYAGMDLADKLMRGLRTVGVAPHTVTITVESATGVERARVWRSADPFTTEALSDRLAWQLRAWVETAGIPGGIAAMEIVPDDLSGEGRQLGLLTDESSIIEAERALARAQAILGPDGVLSARSQGGRMPGERVVWSRWGEPEREEDLDATAPWPGTTPGPSPALVHPEPRPIGIEWDGGMPSRIRLGSRWEPVLTWSGPWRLSGRWWLGEPNSDRYQIVTSVGAFLCVVTDDGAFLVGVYD
jgi:protein ImuB